MQKTYKMKDGYEIKVSLRRKGESRAMLNGPHYAYRIIVEGGGLKYTTTFHDSIANYCRSRRPNIDEAFECLLGDYQAYDDNRTLNEFCECFCYDMETDAAKGRRAFDGCKRAYEGLHDIISDYYYELNEMVVGA